jgi:hypothetical protein
MNLKNRKLIRTFLKNPQLLKKSFIIRIESKRRGGTSARHLDRSIRFSDIKKEKEKVREDLIRSWGLAEIARPTAEERDKLYLYYHYLPWSYLLEVKKKYWNS